MCRFCDIFGKEEAAGRKRKQTTNTKFFSSFKCAYYQQHHENQHAEEWKAYQLLSPEQKAVHFDREVFAKTMLAHVDSETAMHCLIPKPIIDIILGELLLIDGDEIDGDRRNAIIASFKKPYDANEDTLARFDMNDDGMMMKSTCFLRSSSSNSVHSNSASKPVARIIVDVILLSSSYSNSGTM